MCHFGRWTPLTPGKSCLPGLGLVVHAATYWWRPCWLEPRTSPDWNNSLYMGAEDVSSPNFPCRNCRSSCVYCIPIRGPCSLKTVPQWILLVHLVSMQSASYLYVGILAGGFCTNLDANVWAPRGQWNMKFSFCSEDRLQNLSQQEPIWRPRQWH